MIGQIILIIYAIGFVLALIVGTYHAYLEYKYGENIEDYPVMVIPLALCSWWYIYKFFTFYVKKYKKI